MNTDFEGRTSGLPRCALLNLKEVVVCAGFVLLAQFTGGGADAVPANPQTNARLDWIKVSKDKHGFVSAASGRQFIPWGFNYDRDYKSRLLEDYWEAEWPTVVQHFREMKQLGANVVRVHLQFARFMDAPDRPNESSLERLGRLVKLAEETKLYLDLTGLACYRKQDVPAWYNALGEAGRWKAQAHFWEAIARCCAASPAIFCYDLMNEPIVPGRNPKAWRLARRGIGRVRLLPVHLPRPGWPPAPGNRAPMGRQACRCHPQARPAALGHRWPPAQ